MHMFTFNCELSFHAHFVVKHYPKTLFKLRSFILEGSKTGIICEYKNGYVD